MTESKHASVDTKAMRELLAAMSPGPWHVNHFEGGTESALYSDESTRGIYGQTPRVVAYFSWNEPHDSDGIAALRNQGEALCNEIDTLRAECDRLRAAALAIADDWCAEWCHRDGGGNVRQHGDRCAALRAALSPREGR